jgi:hypothetical protein
MSLTLLSEIISNKDTNDIMLIDLANKELREDIKLCLKLISSRKQILKIDLKEYEARMKYLHEVIDINQEHFPITKQVKLNKN